MRILAIYDNPKFIDRYTIVTDELQEEKYDIYDMLGVGADPRALSQWSNGQFFRKEDGSPAGNRHLGKRIRFEDLNETVQRHIAGRILI